MSDEQKLREYLRKATRDLRRVTSRVNQLEAAGREPIAILGIGCRYPGGVDGPEQLWELMDSETDAISTYPENRGWDLERLYNPDPDQPGTVSTRFGGFLHDADRFDADFFKLSPREALAMDPQQRTMLEVVWEACENAGIAPTSLHGSATGVFAGVIHDEYGAGASAMPAGTEAYRYGGTASSVFCGRVAYGLGLQGPAVALDTACSSSLVALHLACQALRQGECSLALAGGVTVMSTTSLLESFSRQRALSPDGRCKSFAAAADGAGFSEGAGVLVLERLSDALAAGRVVRAVVRGSAVNQDGASNGLTAPNGPSQERVILGALGCAGLLACDVDVVEAHGTGTALGDPIEAQALLATYGQGRVSGPVLLGSLKSNIGHTSAAAGVAGVIKMVLALEHERVPATLHVDAPTPHVDWSMGEARLLSEAAPWPRGERPRRAGVSSFGASGTNAHLVLEEAPLPEHDEPQPAGVELPTLPFVLSAKSPAALRGQAERLHARLLKHTDTNPLDVAFSLATDRAQLEERAAVVASDRDTLLAGLDALVHEQPMSAVLSGLAGGGRTVFMFPGQGAQWEGMAAELLDSSPVFADSIAACAEAFSPYVDWSLEDVLRGGGELLERIDVVQPALFAVMVSLAALWRAHGVRPGMVVGHSQGEIAAAYVAGGLSLDDAARVVTLRSQAVADELAGRGGMVSVTLAAAEIDTLLERWPGRLSLAAINGPAMVVVSGDPQALDELLGECERQNVSARRIAVDYASHSAQVETIRERLYDALASLQPQTGTVPFFSTTTGGLLDTAELGPDYWYRSLREPVRFEPATRALIAEGAHAFIEISPHPVLTFAVQATIDSVAEADAVVTLGSLRRGEGGQARFLAALAEAHVHGVEVDWPSVFNGSGARRVELPTYAFQRERHWLQSAHGAGDVTAVGLADTDHPLLGAAVSVAGGQEWVFTASLSLATHAWLADHTVLDTVIVPGAALAELALRAGLEVGCEAIEELTFQAPLVLGAEQALALQVHLAEPDEDGRRTVTIHSRPQDTAGNLAGESPEAAIEWTRHAGGVLAPTADEDPSAVQLQQLAEQAWPPRDGEAVEIAAFYDRLLELGFAYGPAFQGVVSAWRRRGEVFAEIALDEAQAADAARFGIHPALFDAALHGLYLLDAEDPLATAGVPLPFAWSDVRLHRRGATSLRVRLGADEDGALSLLALDGDGLPVLSVKRLAARPVQAAQLAGSRQPGADDSLYAIEWTPLASSTAAGVGTQHLASLGTLALPGVESRYEDPAAQSAALADGALAPRAVFAALPDLDADAHTNAGEAAHERARLTLALLQAWLAHESLASVALVLVTRGALAVGAGEMPDLAAAAALGLVRSAQSEHPGQFLTVDLDVEDDADIPWSELLSCDEPQVAVRAGVLHAPRLTRSPARPRSTQAFDPDGTVLITGGTGGLGALLARHLVSAHGVRRLLLVSRTGPNAEGAQRLVADLTEQGCDTQAVACDVADRDELVALLGTIAAEHRLGGVIHAAGVLEDGVIETLTAEQLSRVMRPKVNGALHLHELTEGLDLDQFVLFSSAATLFGGPGQGNYSAANAYLDALAQRRRAQGLAATSLAWGLWSEASAMTGALDGAALARMARIGMLGLDSEQGLALFDIALQDGGALLAPVRLDTAALLAQARLGMLPALLRGLVRAPARRGRGGGGDLARRLIDLPESEWDSVVAELVCGQVASLLGHQPDAKIDPRLAFKELGFDSLAGVELRNRLTQLTGLRLPATLIFDHPTVAAVAKHLRSLIEHTERGTATRARRASRAGEPIAIVGMGCRYPGGVSSPHELWELLVAGTDAISPFPADRGWELERLFDPDPDHRGTSYAREGGFVHDAALFDAGFFGISPREALAMDPQQRLTLESAWEALEDARIDPVSLRGSETSVFAGASSSGYLGGSPAEHEGLTLTGTTTSVVSGRLAYVLGLEGSAVSIDTACSSSLVALHLACQALRGGECSMALAAGATVQATPGMFIEFSRQRGLSPDGRCKSFGADADGTIWSEGVGVLVLERLSDARRNGHRVQALIRGSATNQDGASNGLTAPHGPSQERVILQALANAGLSPAEVDVVEAHGTGTTLGDPIEAQALLATYGQGRTDGPLRLGSIKSNIGHSIASAGVAGVIKMVMAMRHGMLPRTLHAEEPSPHVDWSAGEIQLLTLPELWVAGERPRRAGVSSFGVSGTNAHVILEEPPRASSTEPSDRVADEPSDRAADAPSTLASQPRQQHPPTVALLVSARSESALRAQASRLVSHLQARPLLAPADVALSLASTRTQFERRAAVLGSDREQLLRKLEALAHGEPAAGVIEGAPSAGRSAFMFSGQGAQRAGMGSELYDAFPVFAEAIDACCDELDAHLGRSLKDVMFAAEDSPRAALLDATEFTQTALFTLEVALFRLLESLGVEPDLLIGHSVGELAAAHVAGVLSLADACKLVAARGRLMGELPAGGAMLAVEADEQEILATLQDQPLLALAAVNAPDAVVVSGEAGAIERLQEIWSARGRRTTRLRVSHAFHSPLMDAMLADFRAVAEGLAFHAPTLAIVSGVSGEQLSEEIATAEYWVRQARETVRFSDGVRALERAGVTRLLELGPDGVLTALARESLSEQHAGSTLLVSALRGARGEYDSLTRMLAEAHVHGVEVDWRTFLAGSGAAEVDLPTYAFQHERYWQQPRGGATNLNSAGLDDAEHPLLSTVLHLAAQDEWLFTGRLSLATHPWLADHAMLQSTLLAGTGFLELALTAGRECGCEAIDELTLEAPLVLPVHGAVRIQLSVEQASESGQRPFALYACPEQTAPAVAEAQTEWLRCASGVLTPAHAEDPDATGDLDLDAWPPPGASPIEIESLYDELAALGLGYGPAFQLVRAAWRDENDIYAEVSVQDTQAHDASRFALHPALLDAALHPGLAGGEHDGVRLPFSWRGVRLHQRGASSLRVHIAAAGENAMGISAYDHDGAPVITVATVVGRAVEARQLQAAAARGGDSLYRIVWAEIPSASAQDSIGRLALLGDVALPDAREIPRYADVAALNEAIAAGAAAPEVVLAEALREHDTNAAHGAYDATLHTLGLLQRWLAQERLAETRLVLLTRGALTATADETPALAQAALAGLLRSAQTEHPGRFLLLDLGTDAESVSQTALAAALASDEPQLALRDGGLYAPRLARAPSATPESSWSARELQGTALISGGTGGLGALLARHLASTQPDLRLLLVSRRGPDAQGALELIEELSQLGCEASAVACDVADRGQLAAMLEAIPDEHPLIAVIHAAGVLDDGVIETLTAEQLERVMGPKVDGALHLHELTADLELAEFVLFSSAAATIGSPGQGAYAAANAFLDALAHTRHAQGLRGTSLAWGLWAQAGGMAGGLDAAGAERIRRLGMLALEREQGLVLLDAALGGDQPPLLLPVSLDLATLAAQARSGMLPAPLRGLVRAPTRRERDRSGVLARRLASAPESEWEAIVLELVRTQVAAVLGQPSGEAVEPERAFRELGFDSLAAVELRNLLHQSTGVRLPATLVFDHPTSAAVARHLRGQLADASPVTATVRHTSARAGEPIAIVGMSCRYPGGVGSPEELWELLASGTDAISPFPSDRGWDLEHLYDPDPAHLGTSYAREGGFIDDAADFDAHFFGISPREALSIDPQQRLLLEGAWEACEAAGIDPATLRGSDTGVFAGVMYQDYGVLASSSSERDELEGYLTIGSAGSVASGRVAYTFGFQGPAMTVDTACSSSLVALHLACQALRQGECSLALAGGVTVLCSPTVFVDFSRQRGLSADGRCKSFAGAADGVGWAEGAGLLLLEPLSEAQRNGHPVLALVRGSAVNQDGASNGMVAPNGPSQERVIRQALANAGLSPQDVYAVEGHGTGTTLGDPIEAQALLATYGQQRAGSPLRLGSIKSNIGHTQAAAGVGGVIKMVMAMRHEQLPATLHVDEPSPHVDWEAGELRLLAEAEPWPATGGPRRAGVSSFGVSGTNAHVILEQPPPVAQSPQPPQASPLPALAFGLSARSAQALPEQARRLATHLRAHPEIDALDVAGSLAGSRARFERRAVIVGADRGELIDRLGRLAGGEPAQGVIEGAAGSGATAFMFTGQGAQRAGMGAELNELFPVFAAALGELCDELDRPLGRPLRELMFAPEGSPEALLLNRTEFAQAALFALEVALFRLLGSFGVRPDYLIGHSIGELAAAHVAGVLSLADACTLVVARGRLMGALPDGGAMLAIEATEEQALESLLGLDAEVTLAAVNSPNAVVLSGEADAIARLETVWAERGRAKRLRVSHAFHSPRMDAMLERFGELADSLSYQPPRIAIVSNVTGERIEEQIATPAHWVRHVRDTVRFADGIAHLQAAGVTRYLELGPDGVLSAIAAQCLDAEALQHAVLASTLRARRGETDTLLSFLAAAHIHGVDVDWCAVYAGRGARTVELPSYPFQRRRYWPERRQGTAELTPASHPLLSGGLRVAAREEWLFSGELSLERQPWLADHAVFATVLAPGTLFVELAFAAGRELACETIDELTLQAPLVLAGEQQVTLQLQVGEPDDQGRREIAIHSRQRHDSAEEDSHGDWTCHATGVLAPASSAREPEHESEQDAGSWPPAGAEPVQLELLYERLAQAGFDYGPAFQGVKVAWRRGEEIFAELALEGAPQAESASFAIHPALLDSAFHMAVAERQPIEPGSLVLPFSWTGLQLHRAGACSLRVEVTPVGEDALRVVGRDSTGAPVLSLEAVRARAVNASQIMASARAGEDSLYELDWKQISTADVEELPYRLAALGDFAAELDDRHADIATLCEAIEMGAEAPEVVLMAAPVGRLAEAEAEDENEGDGDGDGDGEDADEADLAAAAVAAVQRTLKLLAAWVSDERLTNSRLALVTECAMALSDVDTPDPVAAALWGLVRSAQSEHPDRFLLIDLDGAAEQVPWPTLLASDEPQLALRDGAVYVPRLAPAKATSGERKPFDGEGTVLITGGTGGLGALVARHLAAEHGARQLLLLSRRGPDADGAAELVGELSGLGCNARAVACDAAEREQLAGVIDAIPEEHPLVAVIHAAGVLDDATIGSMTAEQVRHVMRPKVAGALNLHELTAELELWEFVMFSSGAATLGSPGQGNYGAANAFLDALAHQRRAQGLAGSSLAWGLWKESSGMGGALAEQGVEQIRGLGIVPLTNEQGLALLDRALGAERALLLPMRLDLAALRAQARMWDLPAPLRGLVSGGARHAGEDADTLAKRLARVPEPDREALVLELVTGHVAAVLGYDPSETIDAERQFGELGMDSLGAVELRNRLSRLLGQRISATLVFDHPTIAEVARFLRSRLGEIAAPRPAIDIELDHLEQLLAGIDGERERERVSLRLRTLLSATATAQPADAGTKETIESGSAEEIFELLDRELTP